MDVYILDFDLLVSRVTLISYLNQLPMYRSIHMFVHIRQPLVLMQCTLTSSSKVQTYLYIVDQPLGSWWQVPWTVHLQSQIG